ncbi:class I SAM-dependent methyltransferase [Asanoa siamensis]|uniref:Methyltransferase type 11 domain-containing protein n=1 Tax=Asanoa siamensis TaxID=926357 RepID=A0ABQ4CZ18_9ACTN|nr:class I SAM-dependent methyltransferase [Asanoa siamensis]GIF76520.1 hypothetical protein Asi02nite_60380 [Asanoa siamensis]
MSDETIETYDQISIEYARRKSPVGDRLRVDLDGLAEALPPGARVLDVGCGPGREIDLLRARGFQVTGVDLSIGQLRTGGRGGVAQADMRHLPVATGSVDAVWCQAALLHLPRASVPAALAEFARVVRPGGGLYLQVAEGDGADWEVATNYASALRRWFTYHRESDLTALLATAGFAVRRVRRNAGLRDWLALHARRDGGFGNS